MVESTAVSNRGGKINTVFAIFIYGRTLALLLALSACGAESKPEAAPFDPLPVAQQVADALGDNDTPVLTSRAHPNLPLRIELRETLVETDERTASTVIGAEALASWLGDNRPLWSCAGDRCRWPGGLVTEGDWNCFGDCCDLRPAGGMELETLYLRRVCLAHRQGGQARLSMLAFFEAR